MVKIRYCLKCRSIVNNLAQENKCSFNLTNKP